MILRKLTVDNSFRYFAKCEQIKEKVIKPNTIKTNSNPRKQNKNLSQNNKNFHKNISAQGFKYLKGIMNCYF